MAKYPAWIQVIGNSLTISGTTSVYDGTWTVRSVTSPTNFVIAGIGDDDGALGAGGTVTGAGYIYIGVHRRLSGVKGQ